MNGVHRWLCRSALWRKALEQRLLPWVLDGVDLGDHLLEVGPGPGLTTDVLCTLVPRVTALEIDRQLATALYHRMHNTKVSVVEGDGSAMPFGDGSFSAVVSLTMLHHVATKALQDRLLSEAYRVLKAGGILAGTDNTYNVAFHLLHLGDTMVVVDPNTLAARLEAIGYRNIEIDTVSGRFRFRAVKDGG